AWASSSAPPAKAKNSATSSATSTFFSRSNKVSPIKWRTKASAAAFTKNPISSNEPFATSSPKKSTASSSTTRTTTAASRNSFPKFPPARNRKSASTKTAFQSSNASTSSARSNKPSSAK